MQSVAAVIKESLPVIKEPSRFGCNNKDAPKDTPVASFLKQQQNGSEDNPVPPKPMPRSRGSIPDENSLESIGMVTPPKPAVRISKCNSTNGATNGFSSYNTNSAFKVYNLIIVSFLYRGLFLSF
jgi:hypothetical protein